MFPDTEGNGRFVMHPAVIWLVKFGSVILVVLLVAVFGARLARNLASNFPAEVEEVPSEESAVTVPSGASARSIGLLLEEAGVIEDGGQFEREVSRRGVADQLQAGDYVLVGGSLEFVIETLLAGPDPSGVFRLTVIEGLTIDQMLDSIADQTEHTRADLEETLVVGDVTSVLLPEATPSGYDEITRWEGLLAPDTYEFRDEAGPAEILARMADTLVERVDAQDWTGLEAAGLTPYEGLIIASLIEREAKLDEDRPLIASVVMNRLDAGIGLQIDATVLYALGEVRTLTLDDLEVESVYNTYKWAGLPPTPIAGVRVASLEAGANPAETGFYYYVVVDTDGRHGFSETLEEHNAKKEAAKEAGVIP